MTICNDLRQAVLQAAMQGKLTEQLPTDSSVDDLLASIAAEKEELIKQKKIKKEKSLVPISEDEIPFDIPKNWNWVRLSEIGRYKKGPFGSALTKSIFVPKSETAIKVYEQKNAIHKDATLGDYYITKEYYETKMTGFTVHPGDIIVSCAGTIGETYVLPDGIELGIINQALMIMNIVPSLNIRYFLIYFDHILKETSRKNSKGSAIKNIPPFDIFKNLLLPLPSVEEQQRIVDKVEELMAKIDEMEKTEQALESIKSEFPGDMKDAILQAAMQGKLTKQLETDDDVLDIFKSISKKAFPVELNEDIPYTFPSQWKHINLVDAANIYTGNSISESIKKAKYTGIKEGYDYIGTKDVGFEHTISYNNGVRIPESESGFKYAYSGATLLCIEGGSAGKKIGMIDRTVCFGNKLCAFNPVVVNPKFLYYYLQSPLFTNEFKNSISGMIGGVSINKIKKMSMPLPSLAEQQRIVEKLEKLLLLCDNLSALN